MTRVIYNLLKYSKLDSKGTTNSMWSNLERCDNINNSMLKAVGGLLSNNKHLKAIHISLIESNFSWFIWP